MVEIEQPPTTTANEGLTLRRLRRGLAVVLLPAVVGLYVGATFGGGTLVPWRPMMVDLDVYRRAGRLLMNGGDIYTLPGQLPFLYPPFAALLAVPLAVLPPMLVQLGWTVVEVLAVLAILYRFGLTGWVLSLTGAAVLFLVEPVSQTLAFGQLGIFLVALVLLDLMPGPRILGPRRLLPAGLLTGLAMAIKLTPGIFLLYLLASRNRRPALVTVLAGAAVTLVAAAVLPRESLTFWGRLAHGDTGLGQGGLIYYTNQSVMADCVRIFRFGRGSAALGLGLSAMVAAVGVWAGALWARCGNVPLALTICGVAGLLASPVSWLHHFVWVVPLGLCLLGLPMTRPTPAPPGSRSSARAVLPAWLCVLGWLFVGWLLSAPFLRLPNGADVELTWNWAQNLLASVTAALGIAFLVGSVIVAHSRLSQPAGQSPLGLSRPEEHPTGPPQTEGNG